MSDFVLLEEEKFHNKYLIQNVENKNILTDTLELHFIEIPKMKDIDESDLYKVVEILVKEKYKSDWLNRLKEESKE